MLKKKITTLLITVALLTSVMPAAFADTTEQPPQMPKIGRASCRERV